MTLFPKGIAADAVGSDAQQSTTNGKLTLDYGGSRLQVELTVKKGSEYLSALQRCTRHLYRRICVQVFDKTDGLPSVQVMPDSFV